MSLLPILGGGGYTPPPQSNDQSSEPQSSKTETSAPTQDNAPPPPVREDTAANDTNTSGQTDQQKQAETISLLTSQTPRSEAQSVVEAQLSTEPDATAPSEAEARRMAEAAQQRDRLEMLIEAIGTPADAPALAAPAAEQAEVGNVETDGIPV